LFRYGKRSEYDVPPEANTKQYQRAFLAEHLPRHAGPAARVLERGANAAFETLLALQAAERWVADPYDGQAGGGMAAVPHTRRRSPSAGARWGRLRGVALGPLRPGVHLLRARARRAERYVLRRVPGPLAARGPGAPAQAARGRDVPHYRPRGVHLHTVDHAPRNVTLVRNFLDAGFVPLVDEPLPRLDELLHDSEAVRQLHSWTDPARPQPFPQLHSVLIIGVRKPAGAETRPARLLPQRAGTVTRLRGRAVGMLHLYLRSWLARRFGI
jgi:hypothetical protein